MEGTPRVPSATASVCADPAKPYLRGTQEPKCPSKGNTDRMTVEYASLEQATSEGATTRSKLESFLSSWYSRAVIFSFLLAVILSITWLMYPHDITGGAGKKGAGLLFVSDKQVLLLLRRSKHNDRTWGLPGGNVEAGDADAFFTAKREASEELGPLPEFQLLTEILTKRGKRQQKLFTVFVCNVTNPPGTAFAPQLNEEHRAFQWFDVVAASKLHNLHPILSILFKDPARKELAAAISADPASLAPGAPVKKRGAGLFLMSDEQVLLLTRNSSHNNATLSVPGGNVDLTDTHLLATAKREAEEEMGACPEFDYKGEVDTRRGKHGQKEFKVFLGAVTPEVKTSFKPVLDHESLAWGWYPLQDLLKQRADLHPVTEILLKDHLDEIKTAFSISEGR